MGEKIFNISREGAREVVIDENEDPIFVETGERAPDKKLKGYISSVFNQNFQPPIPAPINR